MNKAFLIGRLTKDPNVNYLSSGVAVASFTLAVDRTFKNRDGEKDTDFIPIVTWRKTAELCEKYLSKGSMAAVIGRIQTRSYEDKDGATKYVTEIVADEVQFLSSGSSSKYYGEQNNTAFAPSESFGSPVDGFTEINDEDVPF